MSRIFNLNRKSFLHGVGGAAMALPCLDIMAESKSEPLSPMRMVCVGYIQIVLS